MTKVTHNGDPGDLSCSPLREEIRIVLNPARTEVGHAA